MSGDSNLEGAWPRAILLAAALVGGLLVRLGAWPSIFLGGGTWIDGPDGYYHLRRAWLTLQSWPLAPQTDMMIGPPEGGPISWPPVFDLLLATMALPFGDLSVEQFERLGALLPPLLGMLEIALLFWVVERLFGGVAAAWSAVVAAVLPGVSRYSLLGALDHDPLVESLALIVIGGLVAAMSRARTSWKDVSLVGLGTTLLVLTWAGAILHLALLCLLAVAGEVLAARERRESALGETLGLGSLAAAVATLPFVVESVWTERLGATFIGLSWLHTTVLVGAAVVGLALAACRRRTRLNSSLLGGATVALVILAASSWSALAAGLTFFARGEPFLRGVMESRPLLSLLGVFDLTAPVIRLSPLVLLLPIALPWLLRRTRMDRRTVVLSVWLAYTLGLALVQSRYAHAAALPIAGLAGLLISNWRRTIPDRLEKPVAIAVLALVTASSLPAYLVVPGAEAFHLYSRVPKILSTGFNEACDFLVAHAGESESWNDPETPASGAVLAPWSAGHWLIWRGRQAVVTTPLGPQGQPAFVDGVRFYLESDAGSVRDLLRRRRVRYVVVLAEMPPLEAYLELAGEGRELLFAGPSAQPLLDAKKYLETVAARLTWLGTGEVELFGERLAPLEDFTEVYRSAGTRPNPFAGALPGAAPGEVPQIRIFAVR